MYMEVLDYFMKAKFNDRHDESYGKINRGGIWEQNETTTLFVLSCPLFRGGLQRKNNYRSTNRENFNNQIALNIHDVLLKTEARITFLDNANYV